MTVQMSFVSLYGVPVGVFDVATVTTGTRSPKEVETLLVVVPPCKSVAVGAQLMVLPGSAIVDVSVMFLVNGPQEALESLLQA